MPYDRNPPTGDSSSSVYDTWYAPIDPLVILVIGASTVIFTGIVVKFARYVRAHPHEAEVFIKGLLGLLGFYLLGLVVYHGYQRFV